MCEMDTDSAYIAISGDSVESLVKPELREEFQQDKCNWFPRTDTREHKAYDKRTPCLFKVEWEGEGIIASCVLGPKINLVVRVLIRNATTLTGTSI